MKRSTGVLTAVAVAVIAYVGTTWYVGKQAQQAIERAVAQANERMADLMLTQPTVQGGKLTVAEYRRRVFSADVVYSLQLQDEAGQTQEFLLSDRLQHGPFPLAAISAGDLTPMLAFSRSALLPSAATQPWFDSLNGQSPVTGVTKVRFGGSASSDWSFKPLSMVKKDQVLKFSGGAMQVSLDNNFANSRVTGAFDDLSYAQGLEAERISVTGFSIQYDALQDGNTKSMSATTQATNLSLDSSGQEVLALKDFVMRASSKQVGDLAEGSVRYDFGQLRSDGLDLGKLTLGAAARDLSMPALTALAAAYDDLSERHGPDMETWQLSPQEATQLQERVLALLATDPVLTFDPMVWSNQKGESLAKLTVELTRPAVDGFSSLDELLLKMLRSLDLEIKVEKAMFVEALGRLQPDGHTPDTAALSAAIYDNYASRLQAAGLASETDGVASSKIVYRDGRVDANGKVMEVPEFMQRALLVFLL
ncbi:MAG TPA: YdgA family protein [Pusillimonas sp.]|uniref:YdgA family protein n=1 Tax=Pusillimonas sp. TaxID=3040095 RepID=UPI002B6EDE53|nr:YdgA family protein [Pusillimonas sp.]HUH86675.1 YdgA family protein [Pusillimonas sp.]